MRPRARTLSERRSEGTAYDRMRRHVHRRAQRLFRGNAVLRRLHVDVHICNCESERRIWSMPEESTPRSGKDAGR